jgi:hypothetical protein
MINEKHVLQLKKWNGVGQIQDEAKKKLGVGLNQQVGELPKGVVLQ